MLLLESPLSPLARTILKSLYKSMGRLIRPRIIHALPDQGCGAVGRFQGSASPFFSSPHCFLPSCAKFLLHFGHRRLLGRAKSDPKGGGLSQNVNHLKPFSNDISSKPGAASRSKCHRVLAMNSRITAMAMDPPGQPRGPWLKGLAAARVSSWYAGSNRGWSGGSHLSGWNWSGSEKYRGLLAAAK